jgi:hypothetical protein
VRDRRRRRIVLRRKTAARGIWRMMRGDGLEQKIGFDWNGVCEGEKRAVEHIKAKNY